MGTGELQMVKNLFMLVKQITFVFVFVLSLYSGSVFASTECLKHGQEDFNKKTVLGTIIPQKKFEKLGFSEIRKNTWFRTIIWSGTYFGDTPFFVRPEHGILIREKIRTSRKNFRLSINLPSSVECAPLFGQKKTIASTSGLANSARKEISIASLLKTKTFGGYSSVGEFIVQTQIKEIKNILESRR